MSHARETTLVDFLKNPSIMPLGVFLLANFHQSYDP